MAVSHGGSARKPGAGLITGSDVEPRWPAAGIAESARKMNGYLQAALAHTDRPVRRIAVT
jgi:hypothetical protein